jgi:hypothetical protein
MGLSPVAVVIAAIFWSWLWGPLGLIMSTPLTLCLVVLGRHVDRLEFLDVLLGDRPALTPIENFYRMLATTWMRLSSRPSCSSGRQDCGDRRRANHLEARNFRSKC